MKAEIITSWAQVDIDDLGTVHKPRLLVDYSTLAYSDTTGQPAENITPKPNMYIVLIECSPETLQEIEDDPLYYVNWSEE